MNSKRLLVMAGGTGGHLFPGLAVAHYLSAQGWVVRWLGTADRMEADLVPQQGIEIDFINISSLRGRGVKALLTAPRSIWCAVNQARSVIERFQPQVVLGMGGYVSGPGGIAAWLANIPVVVHEQNAVFGLTNRCLSYFACRVLTAFPSPIVRAEVVGNPVRQALLQLPHPQIRYRDRQGPLRILVMGGSQGARVLNQVLPSVAKCLGQRVAIWHQVGRGARDEVVQAYRAVGFQRHQVTEFIDEIAQAYAWADIVICRSGALTVSELAAVGLPAIFIPFQHADRQQYVNAQVLQRLGAADLLDEAHLTVERLAHYIMRYDRAALVQRAQRARASAVIDATQRVAAVIETVAAQ